MSPGLALLLMWLALISLPAAAAPETDEASNDGRWFQVELIVFEHRNPDALETERWPDIAGVKLPRPLTELSFAPLPQPEDEQRLEFIEAPVMTQAGLPAPSKTLPAEPTPELPVAFEMLPEENLQLNDILGSLRRSPRYEPLLHVAWQQPTYDEDQAQTILLYEGMTERPPEPEVAAASEPNAENATSPIATAEPAITAPEGETQLLTYASEEDAAVGAMNPRFVGTVSLSVSRYLHLKADVIYRMATIQQQAIPVSDLELWYDRPFPTLQEPQGPAYQLEEWPAIRGFRLSESRRMRSREVHYLDNPFFGIIALITPVELPEPAAPSAVTPPPAVAPKRLSPSQR